MSVLSAVEHAAKISLLLALLLSILPFGGWFLAICAWVSFGASAVFLTVVYGATD